MLDEAAIAAWTAPAGRRSRSAAGHASRAKAWTELVRHAASAWPGCPRSSGTPRRRPLARHIADTGDLRPVRDLLGALTEAGCDHPTVLDALSEPLVPAEACWMVETLAGAEPGTLLRHHV